MKNKLILSLMFSGLVSGLALASDPGWTEVKKGDGRGRERAGSISAYEVPRTPKSPTEEFTARRALCSCCGKSFKSILSGHPDSDIPARLEHIKRCYELTYRR